MPQMFLRIFFILFLTVFLSLADMAQAQRAPRVRYATTGGAATGEVLQENSGQLQLNVTPCAAEKVLVIFRKPYTKDPAGTIQCKGVTKVLVQAIQR